MPRSRHTQAPGRWSPTTIRGPNTSCCAGSRTGPRTGDPEAGSMRRLTCPPRTPEVLLASWFVVISVMRVSVISAAAPGFDAKLYRTATITWLQGGDPWSVYSGAIRFAAPPPSLLAMLPFAVVPETVAVVAMIGLGLVGTAWALRRLGIPLWWLAFPPFVDGLYNANPHVLLIPLLVAGLAPIAALVKIYAVPVPVLLGEWKAVAATGIVLLVTIPILPWASYIAQFPGIAADLAEQSDGGMSALAIPVLIPVAVVALVLMGRRRAAWWVVPLLWPSTQWYYTSLAMPATTLLAAFVVAVP